MAQQQQIAEPQQQEWSPQFDRKKTRDYIKLYDKSPRSFSPELLQSIRQHAQYHNVPFYEGDFSILESIKQAGAGFIEGFTTLNIAEHPDNEWESVFRSIGHLAGFAPGILSAPLTRLGFLGAGRALRGVKGGPLYLADKLNKKYAAKTARAVRDSSNMRRAAENNAIFKYLRSPEASDIASGAFTLGTASAISSWQQGTDMMIDSFFSGAVAGGVFKGIGNRIAMKDPKAEKYARGLAGSLFMGLPATIRGATMPEQIYEYLMGAYFGGSEKSWRQTESMKWLKKGIEKEKKDPEYSARFDPVELEGFTKVDPQVRELTYRAFEKYQEQKLDQAGNLAYEILKETNQLDKIPIRGKVEEVDGLVKVKKKPEHELDAINPRYEENVLHPEGKHELFDNNFRWIPAENIKTLKEVGKQMLDSQIKAKVELKTEVKKALSKSIKGKGLFVISPGESDTQNYITKLASKKNVSVVKMRHAQEPAPSKRSTNVFDILLNEKDVSAGDRILKKAIKNFKEQEIAKTGETTLDEGKFTDYIWNAINRDARSVKNASQVIAIDSINPNTFSTTKGVSRLPVQMGIDLNKPTFVYDRRFQRWFEYNPTKELFEPLEVNQSPDLSASPVFFGPKKLDANKKPKELSFEKIAIDKLFKQREELTKLEAQKPKIDEEVKKIEKELKIEPESDDSIARSSGTESTSISTLVSNKLKPHISELADSNGKKLNLKGKDIDDKLLEIEREAIGLASRYITKTNETKSQEFINAIEDKVGVSLPEAFKLGLRKYLARQNQTSKRTFLKINDTDVGVIPEESPYTFGNNVRNQSEPPTFIERYYRGIKKTKDPVLIELDALTHNEIDYKISNFDYVATQVEINRLKNAGVKIDSETYSAISESKVNIKNDLIKKAVKYMNKNGYHLYGGVNDKDKLQFVKYHPDFKKVNLSKKGFNSKTIPESIYKHAKAEYGLNKAQHDNMMRSIIAYGEALNEVPVETMAKNQSKFINNAVNQNKRAQIWMTNGIAGDNVFIRSRQHGENLHLSNSKNYKAVMINVEGKSKNLLKALNVELPQGTDGAIIATEATINAMNKDAGMPRSGSNKSFLIYKNPDGTILGKYMLVTVPPKYSKMMETYKNTNPEHKDGLNFLMYTSGIKQQGLKKAGDYAVENGKLKLIGNPEVFEIEPSAFKYSQSVLNNNEMLGLNELGNRATGVTLIKQLMTSQHPNMFSEVNAEVISNMYNDIVQRAFDGSPAVNQRVLDYVNKPSESVRKEILNNFEDIGLPSIYRILKSKGKENQALAQELMQKIVKVHKQSVESLRESGELSGPEAQEQLTEALEFTSAADKALKLISSIEGAYPLYFDKATRPYIKKALRRFVGQRVLTPKVKNAGVFRMRPYDKFMQIEFPEFNDDKLALKKYGVKSDEIFRLGDLAKDMLIQTDIVKGKTEVRLGELWAKANNRKGKFYEQNKEKLEDIFEALSVRVPQDSPSGAQVLKFVGFTGVKNHEILLHSRAMEAQGGADLDGDESFVYFGGRKSSNHGMKKEWKDMFKAQKEEFYEKDNIKVAKDQYRDKITLTPEQAKLEGIDPAFIKEVNSNFYAQFSPAVRAFTGRRTAQSRGMMGPVVVMTANVRQAWSSLAASATKKDVIEYARIENGDFGINLKNGVTKKTYLIPKEKSAEQRDLTKALINFTADPANETGLIGIKKMKELLQKAYFKEKTVLEVNGREYEDTPKNRVILGIAGKGINTAFKVASQVGLNGSKPKSYERYDLVRNVNSAFFGMNRIENRDWTNFEVQEMISKISKYPEHERTTAMFKFGNTLKGFNMDISVFDWVNTKSYVNTMNSFNKKLKDSSFPEKEFKDLLSRTKIREENSPQVDFVMENDLHLEKNQRILVKKEQDSKGTIVKLLKEASVRKKQKVTPEYIKSVEDMIEKKGAANTIRQIVENSSDYMSNALHNMATLDYIVDIYNRAEKSGNKISDAEMASIVKRVDELKEDYSEKAKARNKPVTSVSRENLEDVKLDTQFEQLKQQVAKKQGLKVSKKQSKPTALMKKTRTEDLGTIDLNIKKFKSTLKNPYSKDMFDAMVIGSLRPSSPERLAKFKAMSRQAYQTKLEKDVTKVLAVEGTKTNQHQLYLDSQQISPKVITSFLKRKNEYYLDSFKPYEKKEFKQKLEELEKEVEKFEPNTSIVEEGNFIEQVQGYKGIKKGDLTAEQANVVGELMNNIKMFGAQNKDMNSLLAGIYTRIDPQNLPKKLNQMTTRDFKLINNWFRFMKQGTMEQKLNRALTDLEKAKLSKMDWYEFPLTTNRKMMKFDMVFLPKQGYFRGKAGSLVEAGEVLKPTYYGEILQETIGKVQDAAQGEAFKLSKRFTEDIQYLKQTNVAEDGNAIWRMAIRKLELPNGWGKEVSDNIYQELYNQSKKNNNWDKIKDKNYVVDFGGKNRQNMKGSELIDLTVQKVDAFFNDMHPIIAGKKNKDGTYAWEKYRRGWYDAEQTQPILNYKAFIRDVNKSIAKGEEFNMDLGIDGMRHMARAMTIDLIPASEYIGVTKNNFEKIIPRKAFFKLSKKEQKEWRPYKEVIAEAYKDVIIENTNYRKGYFPHFYPETSKIKKMRNRELDILEKDTQMTPQEKESKLAEIIFKYKTRTGDWDYGDYADWAKIRETVLPGATKIVEEKIAKGKDRVNIKTIVPRMGNQFKRENELHGWDIDPTNVQTYVNNVTNTYFRQLGNILNTVTLHNMKNRMQSKWVKGTEAQRKDGQKLVNGWVNFWKQYVSEAMGNPTVISNELYNDPNMKIQGTLYGAFADNTMAKKVNNLIGKLKIRKNEKVDKYFKDYNEATGKDAYDMRRWSQIEAQWELATLMTHPKTPINNIFGGTLHTASSAGFSNLRKARNPEYLRRINPKWTSLERVGEFMEEIGVGPELLAHEYGLQKQFQEGAALAFTRELAKKFGGNKDASLKDIISLKNKHGVSRAIMDKAVKFMSVPEKALRRDAFMAHYIKAWERLNGAIKNPYDPILIDIGKKGVKATQFLYSAAYRPPFARSGLGKIMTRFQLWSWNAVRFRKDLYHDAKIYGFKGSEAMEKFKRTMAIDAFVYALSSMFMYSLFDQILPAPWNYMQDTSQWLFGDEKERERAFFGTYPTAVAPLAMVTPPIARLPISVIREFSDDDYNKLADYYIYTMFPFGRMIRDVAHPEQSILQNPMRIPEKVFGFPMTDISKEVKRIKETTDKNPTPGFKASSY